MKQPSSGRSRRRSRLIIGASALAAASLALAACSSGGSSSGTGGTGGNTGGGTAASSKYPWCGPKQASIALADGFGDNTWRELTRYSAVTIAAECPSVTKYVYANGEGNTQKAISDINSLVAQGITGIVDFPDAGKAMLPVLTKAYQAGTIVVPYRVDPGGTAGQNYNAYLSTDFTSAGVLWGQDVAKALNGQGNVVFLGGPPANSQSLEEYQGLQSVFKSYPGIHIIGQKPYNVTNWDPALTQQVMASLLSKYPKIDAVVSDFGTALAASFPQFTKAGRQIPGHRHRGRQLARLRLRLHARRRPGVQAVHGVLADLDGGVRHAVRHRPGHQGHGALVDRGPAAELRELRQRQPEPAGLQQDPAGHRHHVQRPDPRRAAGGAQGRHPQPGIPRPR